MVSYFQSLIDSVNQWFTQSVKPVYESWKPKVKSWFTSQKTHQTQQYEQHAPAIKEKQQRFKSKSLTKISEFELASVTESQSQQYGHLKTKYQNSQMKPQVEQQAHNVQGWYEETQKPAVRRGFFNLDGFVQRHFNVSLKENLEQVKSKQRGVYNQQNVNLSKRDLSSSVPVEEQCGSQCVNRREKVESEVECQVPALVYPVPESESGEVVSGEAVERLVMMEKVEEVEGLRMEKVEEMNSQRYE